MDNPVMKIVVNVLAVTENGSPMQSLREVRVSENDALPGPTRIGLDMQALERSLLNPAHETKVQRDFEDGKKVDVTGTLTFFVNGTMLRELGYDSLKVLINKELSR